MLASWTRTTWITSAALIVVGCAANGGKELVDACPPTQIAVPSDSIGHSDDEGRIRYVATIEKLVSGCQIDGDLVSVDLSFDLKLERGPVFEGEPVGLTYYIATVGPKREIVDKELLSAEMALAEGQAQQIIQEELTLQLPASTEVTGSNYSIYLGFQPSRQP